MAVCALEGFWLPLTVKIAGLTETEGRDTRDRLVDASRLRTLDRDRQRFQLSPVVVIAEGYATAATLAEHGKYRR